MPFACSLHGGIIMHLSLDPQLPACVVARLLLLNGQSGSQSGMACTLIKGRRFSLYFSPKVSLYFSPQPPARLPLPGQGAYIILLLF
jgi:hypothetical protein